MLAAVESSSLALDLSEEVINAHWEAGRVVPRVGGSGDNT
jgi:hypothetical protein